MIKNNIILLASLFLVTLSCSKKISIENLDKPFYDEFEKGIKGVYSGYNNTVPFSVIYESGKYEIDRSSKLRKKIIDSLGLFNQPNWLLIKLNSTNYSGPYEKTFVILEKKCISYNLPQFASIEDLDNVEVNESSTESLKSSGDINIYEIYQAFQQDKIRKKINNQPNTNPLMNYKIIFVKDKKMNLYKLSSKDYLIKKWK